MDSPHDMLTASIHRLRSQVADGQPVDFTREAKLQAIDTVYAGQFFTAQALADNEAAQAEWQEAINAQIE